MIRFAIAFLFATAAPGGEIRHEHRLVRIPAGTYLLGDAGHKLNTLHPFKTPGFLISDAETTNAQFAAFVAATGYQTQACLLYTSPSPRD